MIDRLLDLPAFGFAAVIIGATLAGVAGSLTLMVLVLKALA
jgi:hypothetical protein